MSGGSHIPKNGICGNLPARLRRTMHTEKATSQGVGATALAANPECSFFAQIAHVWGAKQSSNRYRVTALLSPLAAVPKRGQMELRRDNT